MSLIALYYVCSVELHNFPIISLSLYFAPFCCWKSGSDNEMARNLARGKLKMIISL